MPEAWIDVDTMEDLDDVAADFRPRHGRRLTVATKYINLTRGFFAGHGIADYRIVESLGATEGAPASGAADLIVDITTTGATLKANGLKILSDGVILRSEAHLVVSLAAPWNAARRGALAQIVDGSASKERDALLRTSRALKELPDSPCSDVSWPCVVALLRCSIPAFVVFEGLIFRLEIVKENTDEQVCNVFTASPRASRPPGSITP